MSDSIPNAFDPTRPHVAAYRRLLALFPSEFRHAYGGLMTQLFRDQCREAQDRAQALAMASLWGQTLLDTGKAAGREHLSNLRKRFRLQPVKNPLQSSLMNAPTPSRYRAAKWLIPTGMLVGLGVAALIGWSKPNEYRSTSVLLLTPRLSLSGANLTPVLGGETNSAVAKAIWGKGTAIARALEKLRGNGGSTNSPVLPEIEIRPGAGNTVLVNFTSTNFDYSREFAKAWAQEFVEFNRQYHRSLVADAEARITQDILTFQTKLARVRQLRDDFAQKYRITSAEDGDNRAQRRLDDAKAEYGSLQMELRRIENEKAEGLALNSPGNRWFDFRLELKRAEFRLEASPNDPALKAEFALRQSDLKALVEVTEELRVARVDSLSRQIHDYAKRFDELNSAFFNTTTQRVELRRLDEEEQRIHQQLDELNRAALSFSRANSNAEEFTILSAGGGDSRPVGPNRPVILFTGFTWGALAGLVLALVRARWGGPRDPGTPGSTSALIPAPIGA